MQTQAYFSNISQYIASELEAATQSIYVAVAWFTDPRLFHILCRKAEENVNVQLIVMDDYINRTYGVEYGLLESSGGKVYLIDGGTMGNTMHNKFCVIDGQTTITGSYNWSIKAQNNHENITITWESPSLASMFEDEFRRIKVRYHGTDPLNPFDAVIICKRLQIIDNLIQLDETDQIATHIVKIREFQLTGEVETIVTQVAAGSFDEASSLIRNYLSRISAITQYYESDLEQLKWEIKYLEIEIVSLEAEKDSILKIISDFVYSYTMAFGEMLMEILRIKKERLKAAGLDTQSQRYKEAEEAYRKQEQEFAKAKTEAHMDLSQEESEELKKKYRKACTLCHPDKFSDDKSKAKAHEVFIELQKAYNKNDLKRVSEILDNLEKGNFDITGSQSASNREDLLSRIQYLRQRLNDLTAEVFDLRIDKTYRQVIAIKNMQSFFAEEKERLEKELNSLKNE